MGFKEEIFDLALSFGATVHQARAYASRMNTIRNKSIKASNKAIKELYGETKSMYRSFIHDFYEYRTRSYIRHGLTAPGGGVGINLFYGAQFVFNDTQEKYEFETIFNADKMEGGYKFHKPDEVLNFVMSGYRFKYFSGKKKCEKLDMVWGSSYKGKYFQTEGIVTINKAYEQFDEAFPNMYERLYKQYAKQYKLM